MPLSADAAAIEIWITLIIAAFVAGYVVAILRRTGDASDAKAVQALQTELETLKGLLTADPNVGATDAAAAEISSLTDSVADAEAKLASIVDCDAVKSS